MFISDNSIAYQLLSCLFCRCCACDSDWEWGGDGNEADGINNGERRQLLANNSYSDNQLYSGNQIVIFQSKKDNKVKAFSITRNVDINELSNVLDEHNVDDTRAFRSKGLGDKVKAFLESPDTPRLTFIIESPLTRTNPLNIADARKDVEHAHGSSAILGLIKNSDCWDVSKLNFHIMSNSGLSWMLAGIKEEELELPFKSNSISAFRGHRGLNVGDLKQLTQGAARPNQQPNNVIVKRV